MEPSSSTMARGLLCWAAVLSLPGSWCYSNLRFVKEPVDTMAPRKDSVVLDCQAHGEPPIAVTWMKNGVEISENERISTLRNGSLYIVEVEGRKGEQSHEGFYQCLARNKHGAILSQRAHLSIAGLLETLAKVQNEHLLDKYILPWKLVLRSHLF